MMEDMMKEHEAQHEQMKKMMSDKKGNHEKMQKEFMKPAAFPVGEMPKMGNKISGNKKK